MTTEFPACRQKQTPIQDRNLHSLETGSRGVVSACSCITTWVDSGRGSERAESQMASWSSDRALPAERLFCMRLASSKSAASVADGLRPWYDRF